MSLQTLESYVQNFADMRRFEEWLWLGWTYHNRDGLPAAEAQRKAFKEVFPQLECPDLPCE